MMKCSFCKAKMVQKQTTFMIEINKTVIVIRNVPSLVCEQCGEVAYSDEVYAKLEKIVASLRDSITEVAITEYESSAA